MDETRLKALELVLENFTDEDPEKLMALARAFHSFLAEGQPEQPANASGAKMVRNVTPEAERS